MVQKQGSQVSKTRWAYDYRIVPAQPEDRLRTIRALLDQEHSDARRRARTWEGRLVLEEQVTHILVVSDSPDQDREVNRRLGLALNELRAEFLLTAPMAVANDAPLRPGTGQPPKAKS
jgi:hypothetical protein